MDHVSFSQIKTWFNCGEQYRRRYILKDIIPPAIVLAKGTSMHRGAEENNRQKIKTAVDLPGRQIEEIAVGTFEEINKHEGLLLNDEDELIGKERALDEAKLAISRLSSLYVEGVAPKYQPVEVETSQEVVLPSGVILLGRIDLVAEGDIVSDLKTTRKTQRQEAVDENNQFTIYSLLFEKKYQRPPRRILIDHLVDKKKPEVQTIQTERKREDYIALLNIAERAVAGIKAEVFPFAYGSGAWHCSKKYCGYWSTCPAVPAHKR